VSTSTRPSSPFFTDRQWLQIRPGLARFAPQQGKQLGSMLFVKICRRTKQRDSGLDQGLRPPRTLGSSYGEGDTQLSERSGEFFLLDAETGIVQPLKGEARPLLQQTFRALQPLAASPDLFWTALPDREKNVTEFGIYNAKTLVFKPLLTLPEIIFNSMDMWVDEREGKFYFVYGGQLLALPLPKSR
jgi:hypothetical protein